MLPPNFDPTIPVEEIQHAYERVYHAAFPELLAVLEYEIRLRGATPRPPSGPAKGPRRSARVSRRAPSILPPTDPAD